MKVYVLCSSFIITALIAACGGSSSSPPAVSTGANDIAPNLQSNCFPKTDCVGKDCTEYEPQPANHIYCPPNSSACDVKSGADETSTSSVTVCVGVNDDKLTDAVPVTDCPPDLLSTQLCGSNYFLACASRFNLKVQAPDTLNNDPTPCGNDKICRVYDPQAGDVYVCMTSTPTGNAVELPQ